MWTWFIACLIPTLFLKRHGGWWWWVVGGGGGVGGVGGAGRKTASEGSD